MRTKYQDYIPEGTFTSPSLSSDKQVADVGDVSISSASIHVTYNIIVTDKNHHLSTMLITYHSYFDIWLLFNKANSVLLFGYHV